MRKRKAVLALSVGAMGLSTAAMDPAWFGPEQGQGYMSAHDVRQPAAVLSTSDQFKEALIEEEGVREVVYRDVAGYPTVGVGHLVKPNDGLRVGQRVSYDRILTFLDRDISHAEKAVKRLVGELPMLQHEFDAMVDLVYNVGEGTVSPRNSPKLNDAIERGDYDGIAEELSYHNAGGSVAKGLVYRSERRTKIFLDAEYDNPRPGTG